MVVYMLHRLQRAPQPSPEGKRRDPGHRIPAENTLKHVSRQGRRGILRLGSHMRRSMSSYITGQICDTTLRRTRCSVRARRFASGLFSTASADTTVGLCPILQTSRTAHSRHKLCCSGRWQSRRELRKRDLYSESSSGLLQQKIEGGGSC